MVSALPACQPYGVMAQSFGHREEVSCLRQALHWCLVLSRPTAGGDFAANVAVVENISNDPWTRLPTWNDHPCPKASTTEHENGVYQLSTLARGQRSPGAPQPLLSDGYFSCETQEKEGFIA